MYIFIILFYSITVFSQNTKPIAVCNSAIQVSMDITGIAIFDAFELDEGSYDNDGDSIFFKVLRANDSLQYDGGCIDLNGDDDPSTNQIDVWFDDKVGFCIADNFKTINTILRVFDKNPGDGPINPSRMQGNGNLVNHFSDCILEITPAYKFNNKPFAVCDQHKQVSIDVQGVAKINAKSFDGGSFNLSGDSVYFKTIRLNDSLIYDGGCIDLNGDDNSVTSEIEVWYDDDVFYCCDDAKKDVLMSLRVFNKDPGSGPVDPSRMEKNGDLYNSYNDCWSIVKVENKVSPVIKCTDVEIACSESLNPNENDRIYPEIYSVCDFTLEYSDRREAECGSPISREYTVISGDNSASCKQIISFPDIIIEFDPCTIVFPLDEKVECENDLTNSKPTWESNSCSYVVAKIISEDTFTFVEEACYKIIRDWAVIDWCKYKNNPDGGDTNIDAIKGQKLDCDKLVEDGYYRYTQVIMIVDKTAPTISTLGDFTTTTNNIIRINAIAKDSCSIKQKFNWKYIITNEESGETIQYSYNYLPIPSSGVMGNKNKDNLRDTKIGELVILDLLPEGKYKVTWTVGDHCGNASTAIQHFKVFKKDDCIDNIAPVPILVDNATINMNNGYSDVKARTFDKGRCTFGSLASFDDITPREGLYFTFSEYIPRLWENPQKWLEQLTKYNKYFFNPETGDISTEEEYLKGVADAWIPEYNSSERRFICSNLSNKKTKQNIYVWDQFAYNTDIDYNNFNFKALEIAFLHCDGGTLNTIKDNINVKLYQNTPNPYDLDTMIKFELPNNSKYKFSIYNTNGKLIYIKTDSGFKGENTIKINNSILNISSGIYLYKIETEKFSAVKKMIKI